MTPIIEHPYNDDPSPGRTIYPEAPSAATPTRSVAEAARRDAKPARPTGRAASPIDVTSGSPRVTGSSGWTPPASDRGERVVRREGDVEADELEAARDWLRHVEAGRIGS